MTDRTDILSHGPACAPVNVVVGHYGVGKTNFSLNWAFDLADQGKKVTLVDFDVVNPYFRSSDYTASLKEAGIDMIAPNLAGSALDNPSISGAVGTVIRQGYDRWQAGDESQVILVDVGGDDAGATVLGRFRESVASGPYQMLYVVNRYRNLTQTPHEALEVMEEIQVKSGLCVTGMVNNSHLRDQTDAGTVLDALDFGSACADQAQVELVCTTIPKTAFEQNKQLFCSVEKGVKFYPVSMLVRTPWEQSVRLSGVNR